MPAEYVPTADRRALVENAAAFGVTQANIAEQLKIDEKTLRRHFRDELSGGKFKVDMIAGKTVTELMRSKDEHVRLEAAKYYTARAWAGKRPTSTSRSARTAAHHAAQLPVTTRARACVP
jgi:AraC-like DNA-binding protein